MQVGASKHEVVRGGTFVLTDQLSHAYWLAEDGEPSRDVLVVDVLAGGRQDERADQTDTRRWSVLVGQVVKTVERGVSTHRSRL